MASAPGLHQRCSGRERKPTKTESARLQGAEQSFSTYPSGGERATDKLKCGARSRKASGLGLKGWRWAIRPSRVPEKVQIQSRSVNREKIVKRYKLEPSNPAYQ